MKHKDELRVVGSTLQPQNSKIGYTFMYAHPEIVALRSSERTKIRDLSPQGKLNKEVQHVLL